MRAQYVFFCGFVKRLSFLSNIIYKLTKFYIYHQKIRDGKTVPIFVIDCPNSTPK